jgi:Skp family chaperone for outer membrane proteins
MNINWAHVFSVVLLVFTPLQLETRGAAAGDSSQPVVRIAVINIQKAIFATHDGRKQFDLLDKKFDVKKVEFKTLNDELDALKRQLETQGTKMNDDARTKLSNQISTKQRYLSRLQEDVQADFSAQQSEIVQTVLQRLEPVLENYARDKNLTLVVDSSKPWPEWPVLWSSPSVEITQEVVEIYNAHSTETSRPHTPQTTPPMDPK